MVDGQEIVRHNEGYKKENHNTKYRNGVVYAPRNSLLTDLFKEKHHRTVYYTFIAISLNLSLNAFIDSYIFEQSSIIGLRLLKSGLKNCHLALMVWFFIFATVLLSFKLYNIWAATTASLKEPRRKARNRWWIFALGFYYIAILYLAIKSIDYFNLPFLIAVSLETETVRLLMKVHSFVRNSAPEIINRPKLQNGTPVTKRFDNFLYFLFAPTLIYRDQYPRTSRIRWHFVLTCFMEFVLCAITLAVVLDSALLSFETMMANQVTRKHMILFAFRCNFTGVFVMLLLFYMTLHALQNLFAELTRFADREFYKDWWCSADISQFLKTWNVLVYNWLFMYIYKDIYENVYQNKIVAKLMVLLASAVIHEIMLAYGLRMFFPFLFLVFFSSGTLTGFVGIKNEQISHLVSAILYCWGSGLILSAYIIEYCARKYLPVNNDSFSDYFVPRSLSLFV